MNKGLKYTLISLGSLVVLAGVGLGIILPIYTVIDKIETAENVWSDSCVCTMVDRDLKR